MPLAFADERVAPSDVVVVHTDEVDRRSVPGSEFIVRLTQRLQPAHAHHVLAGIVGHDQFVADGDGAARECAGHDRSRAGGGERPVDPQPRPIAVE